MNSSQPVRLAWPAWLFCRGSLPAALICFCLSVAAAPTSSDWSLHVWQSDQGLPNNDVTSLAQTDDGYLWVATFGHFARFDGVLFEEFSSKAILPAYAGHTARSSTLLKDSKGGLWLAMFHGPVVCLNSGTAQIFTNNLPDYTVQSMVEDGEGAIWITYHGNAVCRIKNGKVTRFTGQDGLPARYDCALARDNKGRIWFAKNGQVGLFQNGRFETLISTLGRNTHLACANDGGVWVCSGRELFKCDDSGKLEEIGTFRPDGSGTDPTALLEDQSGAVWIGTAANGLFRYDGSEFESIPTSHPYISSLLQDREGNLWVGTGGGGLNLIQPRTFTLENKTTGMPFDPVESICEDTNSTVWATTQNGLLICRNNGSWQTVSTATNWPGGKAVCVAADPGGAIWIGTQSHLLHCLHNGVFTTWRTNDGFAGHVVRGLLANTNGVWIVEEDPNIVQCLRADGLKTFKLPPEAGVPRALTEDAAKNIWVGTSKGLLLRIHDDVISDETRHVSGAAVSIRSLAATPDGSLWIGYAGWGLGRFQDGNFGRISSVQGLFNDYISEIVPDGRGWLWFGSDRGIFKVKQRELTSTAKGHTSHVLSIHYGEGAGWPSLQANFGTSPNVLHSHNDHLWFPTRTTLAVVNLQNLRENLLPPPVLLKQVMVDDHVVALYGGVMPVQQVVDLGEPQSNLRLPPGNRRLEFSFTALCFSAPDNVHFQCRLTGLDDDWVDAGTQRGMSYSRLEAGDYQFRVRARNGDGEWNEASALKLIVTPFFWQTWWFRFTVLASFTLAVIAVVRYVSFRRLHTKLRALEQQAALDKERSRIAKDIHDDLGGSLTQIKLLFELTQRERAQPDRVDSLGQEGLAATRQIIKSMDEIVWAVNPHNDSLPHLIDYIAQFAIEFLAHADIRCRVDLPDSPVAWAVSPEMRHNLFLVVKEALNNVILHSGANEVWLQVTVTENLLTITIKDNGRGFEQTLPHKFADGLRNMQKRMTEIGGQAGIESQAGRGTCVSLTLPRSDVK